MSQTQPLTSGPGAQSSAPAPKSSALPNVPWAGLAGFVLGLIALVTIVIYIAVKESQTDQLETLQITGDLGVAGKSQHDDTMKVEGEATRR